MESAPMCWCVWYRDMLPNDGYCCCCCYRVLRAICWQPHLLHVSAVDRRQIWYLMGTVMWWESQLGFKSRFEPLRWLDIHHKDSKWTDAIRSAIQLTNFTIRFEKDLRSRYYYLLTEFSNPVSNKGHMDVLLTICFYFKLARAKMWERY